MLRLSNKRYRQPIKTCVPQKKTVIIEKAAVTENHVLPDQKVTRNTCHQPDGQWKLVTDSPSAPGSRMMSRFTHKPRRRNRYGQVISETGPALIVLFILILFPLIDLLYMGLAYGLCYYLNYLEVRELAVRLEAQTDLALLEVDRDYVNKGFGKFIGLTLANILHPIPGQASRVGAPPNRMVTCTTRATVNPFLNIPFFMPVVGMNQQVTFIITSSRLQEELGRD